MPSTPLIYTQITVAIALIGLTITVVRMALANARDAGARDERERQMKAELEMIKAKAAADVMASEARVVAALEALKATSNERHREMREEMASFDQASREFERIAVKLEEGMSRLTQDVTEVKATIGGMGKEFEHTIRNLLSGKYGGSGSSRSRSSGAQS